MARINIEDSLFKDGRWWALIIKTGCQYKSLGYVAKAWILAQEHWIEYKNVPTKAWPTELNVLIEIGLAERTESGDVYVKGSKTAFSWLEQRVEAGRKGGRPKSSDQIKLRAAEPTETDRLATASGSNPLTLSLSLTPPLSPNSSSNSRSKIDRSADIEKIYLEIYPLKKGKQKGVTKLAKELKTDQDIENFKIAVLKYKSSIKDPNYIKHFSTFANEWTDWLDKDAGKATIQPIQQTQGYGKPDPIQHAKDQIARFNEKESV